MNQFSIKFKTLCGLTWGLLKWILIAVIIGCLVGGVGTIFYISVHEVTQIRKAHSWIILLLPIAGIAITLAYKLWGMADDKGTNLILSSVRTGERLSIKTMILIFASTVITHLFGGSAGREGAALQIGGSFSAQIGRFLKLDEKDTRIITMCGMSAGFASLFGTPITSAIFAMEVISVGIMHYSAIVPCIISAVVGAQIASFFGVSPTRFEIVNIPDLSFVSIAQVGAIAVLSALLSILVCVTLHKSTEIFKKGIPNQSLRIFVGGVVIVALTFIVGTKDYNGLGSDVILSAFTNNAKPEAFILKLIFTAITLGAGFKGGEIVPVFFIGAVFGNLSAQLVGLDISFGAGLGLVALFCGVTNCPIASLVLSIELFGAKGFVFFAIVSAIGYMLSGYEGLYSEQKILYSKLKPEYIDKKIGG